jgi:hypothetical protein
MQDDWADVILDYLRTASLRTATYQHHATVFVTGSELLGQAIGLEKTLWNLAASHRIGRIMRLLHWRTVRVDNPERGESDQARQLRVFIPPQPEPETLETVDNTSSVTSVDPHKTLLETLETLETVDMEKVSESVDGMPDCPELGNFPGQTGFLGKFKKSTDATVSNVSDSVTSDKSAPSPETLATPFNVSISQPSVSESQPSLARLTPADPCPQCGHNAMQPYKEPHKLLCFRCGGIIPTTWEG